MEDEKRIALLKMGYFPVTDDFWAGAGMPTFIGGGWNWAMRTPFMNQPFMPYRESSLAEISLEEAAHRAWWNTTAKHP